MVFLGVPRIYILTYIPMCARIFLWIKLAIRFALCLHLVLLVPIIYRNYNDEKNNADNNSKDRLKDSLLLNRNKT